MPPVRLEPETPQSQVKHSTTGPLLPLPYILYREAIITIHIALCSNCIVAALGEIGSYTNAHVLLILLN